MKPTAFDSLHPALALLYFATVLVLAMAAPHPLLLAVSLFAALAYGTWLRGIGTVAKSLTWQIPLLIIIVAVNPLFSSTGTIELFRIGTQAVYAEGFANAATMALLLVCVMQWFSNADAVLGSDKVMGALGRVLPTISLMISMVMRLVPRFVNRGKAINAALGACTAASARHATNNEQKKTNRARFGKQLRICTTLMGWSMEDSLEAADSMRGRGWGACDSRTTFRRTRFRAYDAVLLCIFAALAIGAAAAATQLMDGFGFFPAFHGQLASPLAALYALMLCYPLLLELIGKVRR